MEETGGVWDGSITFNQAIYTNASTLNQAIGWRIMMVTLNNPILQLKKNFIG